MATPPSPSMGAGLLRAVVINQPAPLTSPHQAGADPLVHSSDSVRPLLLRKLFLRITGGQLESTSHFC